MPTKPKSKPAPNPIVIPVSIRVEHRHLMLECLELDDGIDPKRAHAAIREVETLLTYLAHMMRHRAQRPLPVHIVAALEPIARKAEELAALVHPGRHPVAVLRELAFEPVRTGALWRELTHLSTAAKLAIDRLADQKSSGGHVEEASNARALAQQSLGILFLALRPQSRGDATDLKEYVASLAEFLMLCLSYLPTMPNKKK